MSGEEHKETQRGLSGPVVTLGDLMGSRPFLARGLGAVRGAEPRAADTA